MRIVYMVMTIMSAMSIGCAWQKDVQDAQAQTERYRLQNEELIKQHEKLQADYDLIKAQMDKISGENNRIRQQITSSI